MRNKLPESFILNRYNEGYSQKDIAEMLKSYNTSIRRVLLRSNINIRSNSEIQRVVKNNPFKSMSLEAKYWLGLLMADGCVTKNNDYLVLDLKEEDLSLMNSYKNFLNSPVNINKQTQKKFNKVSYRIAFKNKDICNYLIKLGVTPNKSKNAQFNIDMDINLFRGLFDGDGGVSNMKGKCRLYVVGASLKLSKQIFNFLKGLGFNPTLSESNRNGTPFYSVNMFRQNELRELFNLLYSNKNVTYMERKKIKFKRLLDI
jgi:hypothetical protein